MYYEENGNAPAARVMQPPQSTPLAATKTQLRGMLTNTTREPAEAAGQIESHKSRTRRIVLSVLYLAAFAMLALLLADGWSYYATPYAERTHHVDYRIFRPAGSRGLIYGIIGASMMILMLFYTIQKRVGIFGKRRSLRPFLDFHIFLGVIGPLFIVLHTSFKVQGLVAVSFWSMVAVALSGYLGRYLYLQIPRNMNDQELSLNEIDNLGDQLTEQLKERTGLDDEALAGITKSFDDAYSAEAKGVWALVIKLMIKDLQRPWIKRRLRRKIMRSRRVSRREVDTLFVLATRRALLKRRLLVLGQVQQLFHYWHVIHKPFAIIMYIIMVVHIGVAVWAGYAWIG